MQISALDQGINQSTHHGTCARSPSVAVPDNILHMGSQRHKCQISFAEFLLPGRSCYHASLLLCLRQ